MQYTNLKINPDILFHDMGDEGILLNSVTSSYYRLSPLGVQILNLLINESPNSFSDNIRILIKQCAEETGEAPLKIQEDIDLYIEQLKIAKVIIS